MTNIQLLNLLVTEAHLGMRLDLFLMDGLDNFSRNRCKGLIKQQHVYVNNIVCDAPNYRLKVEDRIDIDIPPVADPVPKAEDIPLNVYFEDEHLLVVDKPAGLVVHPAAGNWSGTLVNALLYHCGDSLSGIGGVKRPGIVHRLDKETSGLMVVAKHDEAHAGLSEQFADHGREGPLIRAYKAFVWGMPSSSSGTIHTQLDRSRHNRLKQAVVREGGKEAITHYHVLEHFDSTGEADVTLIECVLETGRTHQIRVHLAYLGHPLLGDAEYGAGFATKINILPEKIKHKVMKLRRQALHAYKLGFAHPVTGETYIFESEFPKDLAQLYGVL